MQISHTDEESVGLSFIRRKQENAAETSIVLGCRTTFSGPIANAANHRTRNVRAAYAGEQVPGWRKQRKFTQEPVLVSLVSLTRSFPGLAQDVRDSSGRVAWTGGYVLLRAIQNAFGSVYTRVVPAQGIRRPKLAPRALELHRFLLTETSV